MSTNKKEAERASGLFPFADIHLSTRWVGRRGVLAEATIGKGKPPVDVGVVRLVICRRAYWGAGGAGGKARSMVRSKKKARC